MASVAALDLDGQQRQRGLLAAWFIQALGLFPASLEVGVARKGGGQCVAQLPVPAHTYYTRAFGSPL